MLFKVDDPIPLTNKVEPVVFRAMKNQNVFNVLQKEQFPKTWKLLFKAGQSGRKTNGSIQSRSRMIQAEKM